MFKKLKSLFVVEEELSPEEKLANAVKGQSSTEKKSVPEPEEPVIEDTAEIFDSNINQPAKPQKKFTDILLKAMDKNNLEGNDYLEFKQSLKSLSGVIEDEATRFKSSYAVLKNSGVDKQKLLTSNAHYVKVLDNERKKFEKTFKEQQSKQVKAREDKIKSFQQGISKRKQQLQKLIKEIEQMEDDLKKSKVEINKVAGKVQLTKDQFLASYQMILEQLQSDSSKINQHIS